MNRSTVILWIGDLLTLALVTVFGFATHNEAGTAGARMLTTFLPLVFAWLMVGPHLGVFVPQLAAEPRQLWRPFWAMVLAAPLAAWMRGLLIGWLQGAPLGLPIQPIFVVVIGGVCALALLAWRALYSLANSRKRPLYG